VLKIVLCHSKSFFRILFYLNKKIPLDKGILYWWRWLGGFWTYWDL